MGLKDVSQAEFSDEAIRQLGKQRVTIMLDSEIIDYFKEKSGGKGYQTLINQALSDVIQGQNIESIVRRAIREEMKG